MVMSSASRVLVAIPVYNESRHVLSVLQRVKEHATDVLVIDDGSTDETPCLLGRVPVEVVRHARNRGYGRSIQDAFRWAIVDGYDWVITMDCDDQHEPAAIPEFVRAAELDAHDVISGSRYLPGSAPADRPPPDRRAINAQITRELNERLGARLCVEITDGFCGFKAYRVEALRALKLDVDGYAFPMQFWVQAAAASLRVREIPVKLIYNDMSRSFGGPLDDPSVRLNHYRRVLQRELWRCADRLPESAVRGLPGLLGACGCP